MLDKKRIGLMLISALLLSSFIIPLAFAQIPIPGAPGGNIFTDADPRMTKLVQLLMLAIGAGVFTVSVLYMGAQIFKLSEFEAQLKGELYQLVITVIWGIIIYGAAVIANTVVTNYMQGGDMFDYADNYLSRVNCLALSSVIKLEGLKMAAQYFSSLMGKMYAGAWGLKIPMMPGLDVVERAIDLLQMLITPFSASLIVQQIGLQVIRGTALVFLLPAGLLMRLFPMTRTAGAFMIATAFAFYFVLPFIYVIDAQVMGQLYYNEYNHPMCGGGRDAVSGAEWLKEFDFYDGAFVGILPINGADIMNTLPYNPMALLDPITGLSYVVVQAVFLPALAMVLVVSFVKTSTKFFMQNAD